MKPSPSQKQVRFDIESGTRDEVEISDAVQEEVEKKEEGELVEVIKGGKTEGKLEVGESSNLKCEIGAVVNMGFSEHKTRKRSRTRNTRVENLPTPDEEEQDFGLWDCLKPFLVVMGIAAVTAAIVAYNHYAF